MIEDKLQAEKIRRLAQCRFAPATAEKRFIRQLEGVRKSEEGYVLSERQTAYLERIFHRYRKQLEKIS